MLKTEYKNRTNGTGHWFDAGSMRFFRSRIGKARRCLSGIWYFVSSEQFDDHTKRMYSVRKMHLDGDIETIGDFNTLTSYTANKTMNELADSENSTVKINEAAHAIHA